MIAEFVGVVSYCLVYFKSIL